MERRPNPPGQHGGKGSWRRSSDYKAQLLQKQRLRDQYNIREAQMCGYIRKALSGKGGTPQTLLALLESRLDALVLRAGFARTILCRPSVRLTPPCDCERSSGDHPFVFRAAG
jgi:small subunit ribosomal protein S4